MFCDIKKSGDDEAELVTSFTSHTKILNLIRKREKNFKMQSDDVFCEMINSIQFLNMSKVGTEDGAHNMNCSDSGFNSGAEMNADNIFFYEDSCPSLSSCINMKNDDNDGDENCGNLLPSDTGDQQLPSPNYENTSEARRQNQNDKEFTQIQVNVGIDEDLKMILEMDPSLMDVTLEKAVEQSSRVVECPKILGLPPKG